MDADAFRGQKQAKLDAVAFENSWLQAGFLIATARALDLVRPYERL